MRYNIQTVSLRHIDMGEETYRITTDRQTAALADGIARVGLINPPILIPRGKFYTVVCGFRRLMAAVRLQQAEVSARILDHATPMAECARLAIADNTFQRPLNHIEVSRALTLLSTAIPDPTELAETAADLGLPNTPALIAKLHPLCRLPREVQDCITNNTISLPVALRLGALDAETAVFFAGLFSTLKIGLNKQREVLTLSHEIAAREERPLLSVFQDEPVRQLLDDPDVDRTRKAGAIRRYLKRRRFPTLTRAEEEYASAIKSLKLKSTAKLAPPMDFEGTRYTLTLTFSGVSELRNHQKTIEQIEQHPALREFINSTEQSFPTKKNN